MKIEDITNSIKEKIGEEASGKIADDLANLLINDKSLQDTIEAKDKKIEQLESDKDILVKSNANLLLKIPAGKETDESFGNDNKLRDENKQFDFRSCFKDGKFKR